MEQIVGKTPWLTLHVASPLQSETPLALLRQGRVTPTCNLYVRNNQDLAGHMTLSAAPSDWPLTVYRPGGAAIRLELADLGRYPYTELEMVLQCSGNSRRRFSGSSPVSGAPWGDGAVANVVFGGVRLADVFADLGLADAGLTGEGARFLTARAACSEADEEHWGPFERSVPLAELDDAVLAFTLNGEPLPALHGGPLRLALPGFYGVNNLKWLKSLRFTGEESPSHFQRDKYRLPKARLEPGRPFCATLENSLPSWRMRLKSLLWRPLVGETLVAGPTEFGGVAWTDGRSRVSRVAVSTDGGRTWHDADLNTPESPYAWTEWSLTLPLAAGEPEVWVRAFDDAGNAQPLDADEGWNPAGYEWGSAERVRLAVFEGPQTA